MCIAIYKPEGKVIDKATLAECYRSNPDGAGFMYAERKKLNVEKGFFSFDSFYDAYKKHEHKQTVLHFRIKTHGKVDTTNCHPFMVNPSLGFVHNGVISGFGDADHSDTIGFNHGVLQPLVSKWGNLAIFQDPMKDLIESRIGYSKLIFLDRHGNHNIFNEAKGNWDDGVWYSNTSYKPYVAPVTAWKPSYPNYSSYGKRSWYDEYYEDYSTPVAKPLAVVKKKTTFLKEGDLVELSEEVTDDITHKIYEKGELFEVVAVNQDFTADIMYENEKGDVEFLYNIPFHSLEWVDDFDAEIDPVGVPAYHKFDSPSLLKK
jgi:hypothetical protein